MAEAQRCDHLLAELSDYLDGAAAAEVCADIERHLADCTDCRVVVDTLSKTVTLFHALPPPALPAAARARLYAALDLDEYVGKHEQSEKE